MTVTDEERREVARKMRDAAANYNEGGILDALIDFCGIVPEGQNLWKAMLNRLADMIEPQEITEDTSDGYHTFKQLYYQRMMLFAVLVKEHKERAWKTRRHEDGEPCFGGGWFLVTIDTPNGAYGYHYEDKYWSMFDCEELPKAKPWDGYDERDVGRLMSLAGEPRSSRLERTCHDARECGPYFLCSRCGAFLADGAVTNATGFIQTRYCPHCVAKVMVHG